MGHPSICCGRGEHVHRFGELRFGLAGLCIGVGGDLFGDGAGVFEDGDGQAARRGGIPHLRSEMWGTRCLWFAGFGEERGDFGGGGVEVVVDGGVVGGGREFLEQSGEFEFGEEVAAGGVVDGLGAHVIDGEVDWNAGVDGNEFFREQDVVAIIL
jgi:hypothetical protein